VGITFSRLSLSYWIDILGFITEGKLAAIFIKTFSWGFPTGRSVLLHQLGPITLLIGFAPRQYPKVSNYPMISKNMMDLRSHSHGSRIIYKQ
jgi:hypothetical protein